MVTTFHLVLIILYISCYLWLIASSTVLVDTYFSFCCLVAATTATNSAKQINTTEAQSQKIPLKLRDASNEILSRKTHFTKLTHQSAKRYFLLFTKASSVPISILRNFRTEEKRN
jgi:uncharacterized protein YdeI (YjbR/CyaY-like superfamily)